jgi:hypothetical protein
MTGGIFKGGQPWEGFTFVLAGLKALLEHKVRLNLVPDRHADGLGKS